MALKKIYSLIGWKNKPNLSTPLGATNLSKMDTAINGLDDRVIELDEKVTNLTNQQGSTATGFAHLKNTVDGHTEKIVTLEATAEEHTGFIEASKIVPTASGNTVYIDDASNMGFEGIDFFGESKQMQTTGKNELQNTAVTRTDAGLTYTLNKDKSVTVNGAATGLSIVKVGNFKNTDRDLILSGCPSGGSNSTYKLSYYNESTQVNDFGSGVTLPKNDLTYEVRIVIYGGTVINNLTFKPMIRLASTDATYEPYTGGKASPNPDYPQPIESKIVNRIDVTGSNLINQVCVPAYEAQKHFLKKGTYTVSKDESEVGNNWYLGAYDRNDNIITKDAMAMADYPNYQISSTGEYYYGGTTQKETTFTLNTDCYVRIGSLNGSGTTYLMLNVGTTALPYEPYQSQTVNLSAPIELNGIGGVRDTIEIYADGSGKYIQRVGKMYTRNASAVYTSSLTNTNGNVYILTVSSWEKEILWTHRNKGQSISTLTKDQYYVGQNESVASGKVIYFISDATTTASALAEIQAENSEIHYILLNPIETELSQADINAIKSLHTYKPNTVVMNDADAEMDVHYVADAKTYIDKKFEALASAIVNQ